MLNWTGQRALVTGGNRGIGRAIVEELARRGAAVSFSYWGDGAEAEARSLVDELAGYGGEVNAFPLDLAEGESLSATLTENLAGSEPVGLLVNNARVDPFRRPESTGQEEWWTLNYRVNVVGAYLCTEALWPDMARASFGRIVNVGSIQSYVASPEILLPYGATKAALLNLTRSLAERGAPLGITVNTLAPGMVDTGQLRARLDDREYQADLARVPLGRPGRESEIAEAALFLLGAGFVTGTTLHVNGGEYMN